MQTSAEIVAELANLINKYMSCHPLSCLQADLKSLINTARRENVDLIDIDYHLDICNTVTQCVKGFVVFQFRDSHREYCIFEF